MVQTDEDSITYTLPDKKVEEIMTREVITIGKETPLTELIELFKEHHYHGFPVLHKEKIVGVVTKIDLLKNFSEAGAFNRGGWSKIFATHVKDIMTSNPKKIDPNTYTIKALNTMLSNDIKLLPVIEEDQLMGVISYSDIVHHIQTVSR